MKIKRASAPSLHGALQAGLFCFCFGFVDSWNNLSHAFVLQVLEQFSWWFPLKVCAGIGAGFSCIDYSTLSRRVNRHGKEQ